MNCSWTCRYSIDLQGLLTRFNVHVKVMTTR